VVLRGHHPSYRDHRTHGDPTTTPHPTHTQTHNVTYVTLVVIIVIVQIAQLFGNWLARRIMRR
jgi:hypothetical protein